MNEKFSIKNTTKGRLPSLPFVRVKEQILGKKYDLSLVFIGDGKSRKLNQMYRDKNKTANILSFPLSNTDGEIFINLKQAKKDAMNFKKSYNEFVLYLFIHGCLHLKGLKHGKKMDTEEHKLLKKFSS